MSYLVLARKYRPKNFSELVGQVPVVIALTNALNSRRLHHAYLFTGTRGVGKTTVSRILAKALNCVGVDGTGDITDTPCGVCSACTQIDAGRFIDYIELDAASNRGVEDIQTLLDQAVYKPVAGRYKVFMIDEVHMLSNHAFNAMLKTLEEPPEHLKFVLATTELKKVPVTVLSRCLQLNLRPLTPALITSQLSHILQAENLSFDPLALDLLAHAAKGSMRDALSLTDQAIAFTNKQLELESVRVMLGAVDVGSALCLLKAQAQGDGNTIVSTVEQLRTQGYSAYAALDEMSELLMALSVQQFAPNTQTSFSNNPVLQSNTEYAAELKELASLLPADETQLLYSMLLQGRQELGLAPDEYAGLSMVLLRFLAFKHPDSVPVISPDAGTSTADTSKKKQLLNNPTTPATPVPAPKSIATESNTSKTSSAKAHHPEPISSKQTPQEAISPEPEPVMQHVKDTSPIDDLNLPVPTLKANSSLDQEVHSQTTNSAHTWWESTVQSLIDKNQISALTRELALQAQCIEHSETRIVLRVEQRTLIREEAKNRLQAALNACNIDADLHIELGEVLANYTKTLERMEAEKRAAAQQQIETDPMIQELKQIFGAELVANSVHFIH